jgi:hypothetical protein
VVFCPAGVNAGRAAVILAGWDLWSGFDLPFPLGLRVAFCVVWASALGVAAWGLWLRRRWARRLGLVLFPLYQLYEVGWRLAFVRSDYQRGRLPFVLTTAIGATLIVVWILTRQNAVRIFEMGGSETETANDRRPQD